MTNLDGDKRLLIDAEWKVLGSKKVKSIHSLNVTAPSNAQTMMVLVMKEL